MRGPIDECDQRRRRGRGSPDHRLRSNALGLIETIGQSLAAISPTLTPVLNITVVAGLAGIGCWLSYFIGTLGVVIVAASVGVLAARHREAGVVLRLRGAGPSDRSRERWPGGR